MATTSLLDIPLDKFSRSGLPTEHQTGLLDWVMPQLEKSTMNFGNMFQPGTGRGTGGYMDRLMRGFGDMVEPVGQDLLNKLAGRNMMGSQTAMDEGKDLMSRLSGNLFDTMAGASYQSLADYPKMLTSMAGLGQSSEQPFQPYQAFLNLIMSMT
jgi:hypothetical protein